MQLKFSNRDRSAGWEGHPYLAKWKCVCGEINCTYQGRCHCGCGADTTISQGTYHSDVVGERKSVLGLPTRYRPSHHLRGMDRSGGRFGRVQEELEVRQAESRCICGEIDCKFQSLCHCGCGAKAPIAPTTRVGRDGSRISFSGLPQRYLFDHMPALSKGRDSPFFSGERVLWGTPKYWYVWAPDHPRAQKGRIREHIILMEKKIGRHLKYYGKNLGSNEVVHHINGDGTDNRMDNLMLLTSSEHSKLHRAQDKLASDYIGFGKATRKRKKESKMCEG